MENLLQILHLEDNDLDAEIVKSILEEEGIKCCITRASCRKDYFSFILQNDYDIIIADNSLPDYDGISALKFAKEHKPKIPFVFVSGTIGEERAIEALRYGARDYVLKQHLNKLAPAIHRLINEVDSERARNESEEKYRSFFENSMDAILLASADEKIFSANPAACIMLGYSEEELIKLGKLGIVDMTDPQLSIFLSERVSNGKAHGELILIRKDGTHFPVELTSAIFHNSNGLEFTSMIIRDITQRKLAEEHLIASETNYRRLFESAMDGILILDAETGKIIDVNPFLIGLLGLSKEQFINKEIWEIGFLKDIAANKDKFLELRQKEYIRYEDLPLETFDGKMIYVEFVSNVYLVNNHKVIQCNIRDITEHKKAEELLTYERNLLLMLMDNTSDRIYFKDRESRFLKVNKAQAGKFGLKDPSQAIGKTDFDFFTEKHARTAIEDEMEIIRSGKPIVGLEEKETWPDGSETWVLTNKVPFRNIKGEIIGTFGISTDITELIQFEESLKKQKEEFETIFNLVPSQIWYKDTHNNHIRVNRQVCEDIGKTREEIEGHSAEELFPSFAAHYFEDDLEVINNGKPKFGIIEKMNMADGEIRWIHTDKIPEFGKDDEVTGLIAVVQDITEKKRAEEELQWKTAFLEALVNSSIDGILVIDNHEKKILQNQRCIDLWKVPQNIVEQNDDAVQVQYVMNRTKYPELFVDKIKHLYSHPYEISHDEIEFKDGMFLERYSAPVLGQDGANYGRIWTFREITKRKIAEKELIIAKEKAEESNKLKIEFLAQMSHEIRTPLSAILGNAGYLNDLFGEKMNSDSLDCFKNIDLASKRIIRTVDLILNAAELQTSCYIPNFIKVDLNFELLNKLYLSYMHYAEKRGIELIYACKEEQMNVIADEYSINQIFTNLIENAIKFTRKGKVEILLGSNENNNLIVEIKDTGVGMSKEFLSKLYEPFLQEEQGYTRSFDGNGLGLSLVKKYCEINNINIEVESEKNVGSTFRIIFDKSFETQ
jgi:PAS domain S-box-containing protein